MDGIEAGHLTEIGSRQFHEEDPILSFCLVCLVAKQECTFALLVDVYCSLRPV